MLNSGIILGMILTDISDAEKFATIDKTNTKEPRLQTYINTKKAFKEDMKLLRIPDPEITKKL